MEEAFTECYLVLLAQKGKNIEFWAFEESKRIYRFESIHKLIVGSKA